MLPELLSVLNRNKYRYIVKTFKDWLKGKLKEGIYINTPDGPKGMMMKMMSIISNFEPKETEECKADLFKLRDLISDKLSGGD